MTDFLGWLLLMAIFGLPLIFAVGALIALWKSVF